MMGKKMTQLIGDRASQAELPAASVSHTALKSKKSTGYETSEFNLEVWRPSLCVF